MRGKGSNLHAIWDSKIIASRHLSWQNYAKKLKRQPMVDRDDNPIDWAEQSCRITRDEHVYPSKRMINKAYLDRMRPINERQLRLAGKRLADLLVRTLD